jgi:hypothetical protein
MYLVVVGSVPISPEISHAETATYGFAALISQRPAVEVLDRNAFQVDSFEAANIDRAHAIALGIDAFAIGVNAAGLAKAVFDNVLIEGIGADVLF